MKRTTSSLIAVPAIVAMFPAALNAVPVPRAQSTNIQPEMSQHLAPCIVREPVARVHDKQRKPSDHEELRSRTIDPLSEVLKNFDKAAKTGDIDGSPRSAQVLGNLAGKHDLEAYASARPSHSTFQPLQNPAYAAESSNAQQVSAAHRSQAEDTTLLTPEEAEILERKIKNRENTAKHRAQIRADPKRLLNQNRRRVEPNARYFAKLATDPTRANVRTKRAETQKKNAHKYAEVRNTRKREKRRKDKEAQGSPAVKYARRAKSEADGLTSATQSSDDLSLHRDAAPSSANNGQSNLSYVTNATGSTTSFTSASHVGAPSTSQGSLSDEAWVEDVLNTLHDPYLSDDVPLI